MATKQIKVQLDEQQRFIIPEEVWDKNKSTDKNFRPFKIKVTTGNLESELTLYAHKCTVEDNHVKITTSEEKELDKRPEDQKTKDENIYFVSDD